MLLGGGTNWLIRELSGFVDLLFPPACPLCLGPLEETALPFCSSCAATIYPLPTGRCSCCALPFVAASGSCHLCADCNRKRPAYVSVSAAGLYAGALKKGLQRFKYAAAVDLDRLLGQLLLQQLSPLAGDEVIIPVPLHQSRLRQRGYNQSLLLAKVLAHKLHFPIVQSILYRIAEGHSQQGLNARERALNLNGAFIARGSLVGRSLLLVDDVMTTGATVSACTTALLQAGADSVKIAVVARAPRH